jgi:hypothetical protein
LQPARFITASCLIAANTVYKNGNPQFQRKELSAMDFLDELYRHYQLGYPKFHKMDQLSKLGVLATDILLNESDHANKYGSDETGIVLSNSHGSLDVDLKYARTMEAGASPALFVYTLPNIVIGEIAIKYKFRGENAFFVFKTFNGNFMAAYVNGLFDSKLIRNCICGWVDYLGEDYRALLMLVETSGSEKAIPFTAEGINLLNNTSHG